MIWTRRRRSGAKRWAWDLLPPKLGDENYVALGSPAGELDVEVQKVGHDSRVHIDIETDDIEAEARRLEALGAKRLDAIRDWLVMEAPTGQRFCLVPPQRPEFESEANQWA
jgi:hypothetical protein